MPLNGFVIDVKRDDLLIEIQTSSFGSMGRKLDALLEEYRILLVHPVATRTWLNRPDAKPKRSPKKGSIYSLFEELVSVPTLLDHPNLTLDIVLVHVDKHQVMDPKARRGRGGFRTVDRSLRDIEGRQRFSTVADLMELIPDGLPEQFTTADLAAAGPFKRDIAQRMAYCFRPLGVFVETGRTKAGYTYRLGVNRQT